MNYQHHRNLHQNRDVDSFPNSLQLYLTHILSRRVLISLPDCSSLLFWIYFRTIFYTILPVLFTYHVILFVYLVCNCITEV